MASFSVALSGLSASSSALNVISNNLANLNTVGFKDQQASFEDLFYQNLGTSGSGDPIQEGSGTQIGAVETNYSDGTLQDTGVPSNVAITGNGFFITQNANGTLEYTR
ncbi:MAG: flagellar hook-basal body complex protein, partial [Terriglobales bacterium]